MEKDKKEKTKQELIKKKRIARAMPYNIEAEQSVLGCCLLDENALLAVMGALKAEDFYTQAHKTIFENMQAIYNANKVVDYVTLSDELDRQGMLESIGGIDYIITLTNTVPSATNVSHYISIVKRDSTLRKLITSSQEIIDHAYDPEEEDVLAFAEKNIFDIAEKESSSNLEQVGPALSNVLKDLEEIQRNGGQIKGIPSGFSQIDAITNGFHKSELIILAARPGFGKSSLAMNFATNIAIDYGKKCAFFALEMDREQIMQRALCSVSGVSLEKARKGKLTSEDWKALFEGNKKLADTGIYIDDSSLNTPAEILSKCRRLKREKGLDMVVIDYLQLMSGSGKHKENRQQEISELTRSLKIAARELEVPIILLSQLSRAVEQREDHRPIVSDLRESGSIEQDADIVMFIYSAAKYSDAETEDSPDTCEIIVAKNRNGPQGTAKVRWVPEITTFVDIAPSAEVKSLEENIPPERKSSNDSLPY